MAIVGISEMRMRRKAFAMEASTPTREKDDSSRVRWWNWTLKLSRNSSRDQLLSSPGKCPGKSVEVTSVTVSLLMPTV
jgi:hypothetical protein